LIAALQAAEFGCQVTVLHDQRPTLPQVIPPHGIAARPGFILNGANNVAQLALGVAAERADYVVIQHHAALISWEHLADLLQHPAMAARCVVVALHNTQDILTLSPWLRQQLYVALRSVSRVVVHTPRDMALLHAFGLDNLYRLAHGCPAFAPSHPARDLPQQSAPLIGSSGFLLPHKGAQGLIRAVAALRDVWPDIRLRLVMAKYPLPTSEAEFRACANLARKLRFESHLEWHTAFMAENGVRRLLSECDLLVLPYGKTPEASSASARMAVASGAPTLVSEQAIFDDLHDAVGRVSPTVPGGLAGEIEQWLHTARRRDRLQQQARLWQAEHDWHIVGRQMAALLDSIVPDPRS
jgi:glycosyltransferase involved in cell wall biosynthesis